MVSAKGRSAYIWDFESGKGENVFGRYESYGALQFFTKGEPVNDRASGYHPDKGWDWSRIPGATAIRLPLREMEHRGAKTKALTKGKHRNFTDQTFLAGVSSGDGNGIFANKIHDTAFDPGFWARKSVFFFNDLLVCLGNGISSSNKKYNTETTLFQIYDNGEKLLVNGANVSAGAYNSTNELVFEAPDNNVYIIPAGQVVNYNYQEQNSISESGKGETKGRYYTAWINHGKSPKDATYEYAVLVNGKNRREREANYKVLQKDDQVHIVQYENQMAYVIWDEEYHSNDSYLYAISVPGVAMITDKGNKLELAFSDPDLRRPKLLNTGGMEHANVVAPSYPQLVRLTLNGKYKLKNSEQFRLVGYHQNTTILEVMCKDGATYQVTLIKN
jgi:chondroitin-sulfate-ABC endolyase/exolyase